MWFWWALSAALVSAISVIHNKKVLNSGIKSSVLSLFLFLVLTAISLPLMLSYGGSVLNYNFFLACAVSALVFSLAKTMQLNIFKQTSLSDIYTLNSLSPVTLFILSVLFLSEQVKLTATIGILIMATGIYILNYDYHNKNPFHPLIIFVKNKYSQLYVAAIILSNISAIAEKTALNNTFPQNIFYLAFWENFFLVLLLGGYVVKTNKDWKSEIKNNFFSLIISGLIFTLLYFLVLSGFKSGPIALVAGVKKLEVLFVIIFSFLFFGEKPAKKTYLAAILMILSVLLIKF